VKIAFLIFILVGITFLGCSDNFDNTLVSTSIQTEKITNSPNSQPVFASDIDITDRAVNPNIIVSKIITGETGGELLIDTTYINYQGRLLNVYGRLIIDDDIFQGTTEFTMILNPQEASIQLFPHMVFDDYLELYVTFEGIDLEALGHKRSGDVDFVFF